MKSLKQNHDKHLLVTVIVVVVLPIILGFSTFILTNESYQTQIITFFIGNFNDSSIGFQFFYSLTLVQYVIFAAMLIFYPFYPLFYPFIFSIENHLNRRNPKSALTEYEALKKIVYVLLPLFFFTIALRISSGITEDNPLSALVLSIDEPAQSLFLSILGATLFAVASALLRITLLNSRKRFKFYLARLSFRAMPKVEDEIERVKYLVLGLGLYNKYIRRTLGLQINDLKVIYSKIIADAAVDRSYFIKELGTAFEDNDKLKPIRCLTRLFDAKDPERFLVKESVGKKLGEWATIIGTIVSTIAAFIAAVATLLSTTSS
jgi:hypothetical protein